MSDLISKATGCLAGVALGDAMGRATEFMTREKIRETFGWLDHFAVPMKGHPAHNDPLGKITDDTDQTLIIARLLAENNAPLTAERVANAFVDWAKNGFCPYLGPSTHRALTQLMNGASPHETGKHGVTNGAAMRVAPIGIAHIGDFDGALRDAVAASVPTHNTHNAMQSAAAVACAVAAAMTQDATIDRVIAAAMQGAERGRTFGAWSWATPLEKRIELAERLVTQASSLPAALQSLYDFVGVGLDPAESVASALGVVVAAHGDPMQAIFAGVNIGGDTDTIAAIAGGICGALRGIEAIDAAMLHQVEQVNTIDLSAIARAILKRNE
ncbi:MAG: ADP-ribosylglycohydrolase family protein [Chloroflexi bacterium]|nr:ADP-ribosylglycohydrolase family protein [Chloroflexota bacterium]